MPNATQNETPKVNPRTKRSEEKLEAACELVRNALASGDWVSSKAIHTRFAKRFSDGMFGRVKSALNIEHRRVVVKGKARYEWRLPKS